MSDYSRCDVCGHSTMEHTDLGLGLIDCIVSGCLCHRRGEITVNKERWSDDGWPVGEDGKRTDPLGAYLASLTLEEKLAWGATCSLDIPRLVRDGDRFRVVYPWEEDHPSKTLRLP